MIEENADGIGEVSAQMVEERAKELALIAARPVNTEDTDQALCELTGEPEIDAIQATFESLSEDERWSEVPNSTGHQVENIDNEDEGEDGRDEHALLCEEGVREAAHDQMLQAAIVADERHSNV